MDPVSLAILATVALAGTGAGAATFLARRRRRVRREAMHKAVRTALPCGADPPSSLFDVFWDLGASDFALEMMAHRGLLLDEPRDLAGLAVSLPSLIAESGGYSSFIEDQLEAIQELYRDHRAAGDRRAIPALATPMAKALPPAGGSTGSRMNVSYGTATPGGVSDRGVWRMGGTVGLLDPGQAAAIDIDAAVDTDPVRLLGSLFDGSIGREAKRWLAMREARKIRTELDAALVDLLAVYMERVRPDATSVAHLYDPARRWAADAARAGTILEAETFAERSWALCARVLLQEAQSLANSLARTAQANVDATLHRIDQLATTGQPAMAGYLVYVNRYALFVGRLSLCQSAVSATEHALAKLQTELGSVSRKGLL